jgi:L-iditol 2-dehydrogenase
MTAAEEPMMQAALLYGPGDLRVEKRPVPEPGIGELLIRLEACGICPTDVRKFRLGADHYPLNPGHEWVGRVVATAADVEGWPLGTRIYGDTYAGYAEYATMTVGDEPWSAGPIRIPDDLPPERAVFIEPLADCLHAVHDQARVEPGERVLVFGAGQMGLQLAAAASLAGARTTVAEPIEERRAMARAFGAAEAVERRPADRFDAVILSVGIAALVQPALESCAPGGRVVVFAGSGDAPRAEIDIDLLHYRELTLVGSEWVGTPPNQRRERYAQALELLTAGRLPVERLVTARCRLDGLPDAFADAHSLRGLKTLLELA